MIRRAYAWAVVAVAFAPLAFDAVRVLLSVRPRPRG
jgi:hypothetical protein